ncbi:MAG: hypothetical protein H7334_11575 [Ferruginibacter sp.]|nr:hypothetical protein [Ferruginibacter sp.]
MKPFYNLTEDENGQLLLLPVYISLQAISKRAEFDKNDLKTAVRFAHTQTFSCKPILIPFYQEVDKEFESTIYSLFVQLPVDTTARKIAIEKELELIEQTVYKLDEQFILAMHQSMRLFGVHIARAQKKVLTPDALLPVSLN